jgi:hypothetical protein
MNASEITDKAKIIVGLLKNEKYNLFGTNEGQWKVVVKSTPSLVEFVDIDPVENFIGSFFRHSDGVSNYFNPPDELGLVHDDSLGKHNGFWKQFVPKEIQAVRGLPTSGGMSAPKSSAELRSWDSRRISKYLLGEAENYEALYACIISQLENVPTNEAQLAIEQLTSLMETTTETVSRPKVLRVDDEDEISRKMEALKIKRGNSPKKPSPKKPSPKKPSPSSAGEDDEMIIEYEIKRKDFQKELIAARRAKDDKKIKYYAAEIKDVEEMLKQLKLGFGRSRLKPNRRRKSRRTSHKRMTMMTRRTSRIKRKTVKSFRSLKKKIGKRTSRKKLRKGFGSSIYGLQGGMQSGPIFPGVYPMSLSVNETLPNLNNVKRSYSLNEFGKKRASGRVSLRRKQSGLFKLNRTGKKVKNSEIATVISSDDSNSCGSCGSCGKSGRSFGSCGCGVDED